MATLTHSAQVRRRPVARAVEGQEVALVVVLAALWIALSFGTSTFLSSSNISNIFFTVAPIALVGIGMTAVIVTGGIDVSVGSQAAVVMVVVAKLVRDAGVPVVVAVVVAVAVVLAARTLGEIERVFGL